MFLKPKIKFQFIILIVLALAVLIAPQFVSAQTSLGLETAASTGLGTRDLKDLITLIIRIFLGFLGIIAVSLILYGGFVWMTANGEAEKIEKAKKVIINAVIGLVIVLSAYGIVMFVVSRFGGAVGSVGDGNEPGGGGGGFEQNIFRVTGIQPHGNLRIRNVVAQISFNKAINQDLINQDGVLTNQEGIKVEQSNGNGGFARVAGTLTMDRNNRQRVLFTPATPCPEPNQSFFCLAYNEDNADLNRYKVTVESDPAISLRSADGLPVSCDGNSCSSEFTVGAIIDTRHPIVNFTEAINRANQHLALNNNAILSVDEAYQLLARAIDDGGLAGVDFYVAGEYLFFSEPAEGAALDFIAQAQWLTSGLAPASYQLAVRAYDLAGQQSGTEQITIRLRPAHCFNNQQDENLGETGIDCGGECGVCPGELCGNFNNNQCLEPDNQACASGICDEQSCRCAENPQIMEISPDNAAPQNWVTIFGRHFGSAIGTVKVGGIEAAVVSIINNCKGSWQDDQIIIELPQGLEHGNRQVQVITAQSLASNFADFLVNDISRPAICFMYPSEGAVEQIFGITGKRFGDPADQNLVRGVYFGSLENGISATNQSWFNADNNIDIVRSKVPNLTPGQTSVRVKINGQDSNALRFNVLTSQNQQIAISDFSPKTGRAGQYVYIYGRGFGRYQANRSQIKFSTDVLGSFDFPAECLADNGFWTDTRIIVKAPEGTITGPITVINQSGQTAVSADNFSFQENADLTPGLCSLHPQEGEVGSTFDAAGEYFENSSIYLGNLRLNASPDNQGRHFTGVAVPEGASSGPVKVKKGENLESNALDFAVIERNIPGRDQVSDYYQWQFTTCENCLVPEVVENGSCLSELASPTPINSSQNNFNDAVISATFNTTMKQELFELGESVVIESCGQADQPAENCQEVNLNGSFSFGEANANRQFFTLTLASALNQNTWYKVTLQNLRSAVENLPMNGPYSWQFKTRADNNRCAISRVQVNPAERTIESDNPLMLGQRLRYQSSGLNGENCNVCPSNFNWTWSSSDQNNAAIDQTSRVNSSLLEASGLTSETAQITAQADIDGQQRSGVANVDIVPFDPGAIRGQAIITYQPTGNTVCTNALAQVQFNLPLVADSIASANFEILKYDDDCANGCSVKTDLFSNQAGNIVNLQPLNNQGKFAGQTRYGVKIRGGANGVKTAVGEILSEAGCANGLAWESGICSWEFTTQADACAAKTIQIYPESAAINLGEHQGWQATAVAENNQPLSDEIQNWHSVNSTVANVLPIKDNSHLAVSEGLDEGATEIQAGLDQITGSADLEVKKVPQGPQVLGSQPTGDNVCRNALIQINFDQVIEQKTITSNSLKVQYVSNEAKAGCEEIINRGISFNQSLLSKTLISRLVNWLTGKLAGSLINSVSAADAVKTYFCPLSGDWAKTISQEMSQLKFILNQALPPLADIRVTVKGGAEGIKANNLPMEGDNLNEGGDFVYNFRTRADVCALSSVTLMADPENNKKDWTFTTSFDNPVDNNPDPENEAFDSINDSDKKYTASGFSATGQALISIPEVYEWAWAWGIADQTIAQLLSAQDDFSVIGAQNKNGRTDITVTAGFPNWYKQPALKASALATVDICENHWNPAGDQNPDYRFIDSNFNFSLSYCRDFGEHGLSDDLPALELPQPVNPNEAGGRRVRSVDDVNADQLLREYLLPVPTTGDVIGIRIYSNLTHLSPTEWYEKNIEVKGRPIAATVDGYQAIQDGRTTYVAAANVLTQRIALNAGSKSWLFKIWDKLLSYFNRSSIAFVSAATVNINTNSSANTNTNSSNNTKANYNANSNVNGDANAFYGNIDINSLINQTPQENQLQYNFNADNYRLINSGYQAYAVQSGYTNIYLFSYNQNADPKTTELLKRLMAKWQFNANIDNPQLKEKIQRDVIRLADLSRMAKSLDSYQASHQDQYPRLLAGSFISGMSTSKWPSWNQELGRALGIGLPEDPINKFNACINCAEPQLLNPGFEDGQDNWRFEEEGKITNMDLENTTPKFIKAGGKSLHLNTSGADSGISQLINLQTSTTYEISAWVYIKQGRVYLSFWGDDFGNEWISPPDHQGWYLLKNRLVTNSDRRNRPNTPGNGIFIRSYSGNADFYIDEASIKTAGGNCGYDKETCWNPQVNNGQGSFACDGDSYFYSYQTLGPSNYSLSAKMESAANWLPIDTLDRHLNLSAEMVRGCTKEVFGSYCGNGSVQGQEQCEPGMSKNLCSSAFNWYSQVNVSCQAAGLESQCQWYNPLSDAAGDCNGKSAAQCCGGYCGDGILNTAYGGYRLTVDEQCDASVTSGNRGFGAGNSISNQYSCGLNCRDIGGWCGDGLVQEDYGEQCDGNVSNFSCGNNAGAECNNNCQAICPNGGELEYHLGNQATPG